jgi:predicted nucleic acid-binding protein
VLVVDSGVWIDFFRGADHPAVASLARLLADGEVRIVVPDLVLYEVLRGFRGEREFRQARVLFDAFDIEEAGGEDAALHAAQHYRALRAAGFTVRSGIEVLVAAFCIERDYALLHADRDFDAFERLRGLKAWRH